MNYHLKKKKNAETDIKEKEQRYRNIKEGRNISLKRKKRNRD